MKLFIFISTAALWLGFGHAYAQSQTSPSLPVGMWVLVDMETFDADGHPVVVYKNKSDLSYKPQITNSEIDFQVHGDNHLTFFKQERLERGYEVVGDKLHIYPGLRGESAYPLVTFTLMHLDSEKMILVRSYEGNTLQYTYRLSK
jgi:hypothetical protein